MPITEVSPLAPSPSTEEVVASDLIAQEQQKRRDFMQRQVLQQKAGQTGLLRTAAMDALDLNPMTWSFNGGDGRIFDSFRARVGTGMYQAVATTLDRRNVDQNVDAEFNPYGFIRDNPTVFKNDPLIDTMVERGQFDGSHNIDQFWYDYTDAKRFFDQQQQIETDWKNGHYLRNAATFAANMALDPINYLPLAFVGKGASFLRGTLQSAGGVAALSLASKKILDAGQPVANEPGLSDEGMALVEGAIVGGGLHGLIAGAGMALKTDTARRVFDRVARSDKQTLAATFEAKARELEPVDSPEVWTPEQAEAGQSAVATEQKVNGDAAATGKPAVQTGPMDSSSSQIAPPDGEKSISVPGPSLPELAPTPRRGPLPFTKSDLERRIDEAYQSSPFASMGENAVRASEASLGDNINAQMDAGDIGKFVGRDFPQEVKMLLEGPDGRRYRRYLKLVKTDNPPLINDFVSQNGIEGLKSYLDDLISNVDANRPRRIDALRKMEGSDPQISLLLHIYENLPGGKQPIKQTVDAAKLPLGSEFSINGEKFAVTVGEDGYLVLKDGIELPLEGLSEIPIDRKGKKGTSLRMMTPEEIAATRIKKAENGPLTPAENAAVNDLLENELLDYWYAEYGDEFAPQAATFDNDPLTEDELLTVSDLVGIDNLRKYSNAELRRFLSGDNLPGSVGAATATEIHTPKQMHPESVANSIRATYRELEWHLQQTPVDNTNITVTAIPGDKAWSLIEQLRAKYEAAGKTLIVHQSNEQPLYELFRTAADFTNRESQLVDALPKDFLYGGIDTAAAKIATRILDFTSSWATINGRLASQTMLGRISDVWKTVSGSSMTIPTGSAKDPFGFRWGTSAENFKLVLESKMTQAKQGIVEVFKAVDRKAEPIVFGDRTVTNFKEFGEALSEYAHQVQAQANGITDKAPHANTSKAIKDAYTFIRTYMDDQYSMMVEAGMLEAKLHPIKRYYSAVWKFDRVKADPVGFKFALEQEYRRVEAMKNGVQVPPDQRPIVAEAAKRVKDALMPVVERRFASRNPSPVGSGFKLSAKDPLAPAVVIDEAAFLKELAQMTEGELRGDGLGLSMAEQQVLIRGAEAYEESVRKFYREAAENAYASLTNKADPQSIPTDGRTMRVDYSRMQPWLETNPMVVLDRYHHVVGGRLAVRRSIQLNPEVWGDAYLKDGTRVNDGATMKQYIGEMIDALDMAASHADSLNGVDIKDAGKPGTKLAEVAKLRSSVYADIAALIDKVEGRSPMPDTEELSQVFIASSRTVRRLATANLMNSNLVNQAMDVAGIGMVRFAQNTEFVRMITGMAKSVRAISKKDMAPMLAQLERASLSRSFGDMDVNEVVLGHSQLRRAVRGAEGASIKLVDWQQKITLMDWWTKTIKQVAGRVAIEQTERNVRKMIRAYTEHTTAPSKGGIEAAMRKAGIDGYDARRTNFLVGNIQEMQLYAEQVYEHGFLDNGNPVKSEMTYEQFLATKKRITANFAEWETANPDVKNLLEKVQGNLAGEVNHRMVVTPGAGDQGRWATGRGAFAEIGKMGTQFLNFQLAQSNQMFRTMAQQGAKKQANFFLQMFGLAVLVDLLKSELSGKRTAEQTAELWQKNPLGMTYNAMDQGGFLGILGKPMGIIDSLGSPYTPGNLLKAPTDQTAVRRRVTEKLDLLGPAPSMMGKAWDVFSGAASGRFNQQLAYNAWKLAPYQNLWWLRLLNRTTGLPVVPESIRPPSNTPQQQPRV